MSFMIIWPELDPRYPRCQCSGCKKEIKDLMIEYSWVDTYEGNGRTYCPRCTSRLRLLRKKRES